MTRRIWSLALVALLSMVVAAGPALAGGKGKGGGNGGGAAIWIESVYKATASEAAMAYQDAVTFGYVSVKGDPTDGTGPWLHLMCYQNGNLVFGASRAGFDGGWGYGEPFQLGPSAAWQGGDADCVAMVGYTANNGRFRSEADIEFFVSG